MRGNPSKHASWYDTNLFWGSIELFAALVLTAIAAKVKVKDLRWLLWFAWPLGCAAVFAVARDIRPKPQRWLVVVGGAILVGVTLASINVALRPPDQPPYMSLLKSEWSGPSSGKFGYELVLTFKNIGQHTASNISIRRFSMPTTLDGQLTVPPALELSGEMAPGEVTSWYSEAAPITSNLPAAFYVFMITYADPLIPDRTFTQTWFLRWAGATRVFPPGTFDSSVNRASRQEMRSIVDYLAKHGYRTSE
jgi:hypothetical protein